MFSNTWTQFSYPNKLGFEIKENVGDYDSLFNNRNTTYTVEIQGWTYDGSGILSPSEQISIWCFDTNATGLSTNHLTFTGTKSQCNGLLEAIRIASQVDNAGYKRLNFKVTRTTYGSNVDVISDWNEKYTSLDIRNQTNLINLSIVGPWQEDEPKHNAIQVTANEGLTGPIPFGYTGPDYPYAGYENTGYDVVIKFPNYYGSRTVEKVVSNATINQYVDTNNDYYVEIGNTDKYTLTSDIENMTVNPYRDYTDVITVSSVWTRKYDSVSVTTPDYSKTFNITHDEVSPNFSTRYGIYEETIGYDIFNQYSNFQGITDLSEQTTDNVTYRLEMNLIPYEPYVSADEEVGFFNEHYFAEDYASYQDYVVNTKEIFTGTKSFVNSRLQDLTFTSLSNENIPGGVFAIVKATADRYVDGVFDTNFVTDKTASILVNTYDQSNVDVNVYSIDRDLTPDDTWEWISGSGVMGSWDISRNPTIFPPYFEVIDGYVEGTVEPLYRAIFTSVDNLTYYDGNNNEVVNGDTGWVSKYTINYLFDKGMTVYGYPNTTSTTVETEVQRKLVGGEIETIFTGSRKHRYLTRPDLIITDYEGNTTTLSVPSDERIKIYSPPKNAAYNPKLDFAQVTLADSGGTRNAFSSTIISPPPIGAGIAVSQPQYYYSWTISNSNATVPVKWDFGISGITNNAKQVYRFTYYSNIADTVTSRADLDTYPNVIQSLTLDPNPNSEIDFKNVSSLNNNDYRIDVTSLIGSSATNDYLGVDLTIIQSNNGITTDTYTDHVLKHQYIKDTNTNYHRQPPTITDVVEKSDGVYFVVAHASTKFNIGDGTAIGIYRISQDVNNNIVVTTVKEIFENYTYPWGYRDIIGQLSDDTERLVVMRFTEVGALNELAVYEKDEGGTDNWGKVTSRTATSFTPWFKVEKRSIHSFYNGTDTVVTKTGSIYQKDEGGTDNWGYKGSVKDKDGNNAIILRCGFTSECFYILNYDTVSREHTITVYDHDTIEFGGTVYTGFEPQTGDTIDGYTVNHLGVKTPAQAPYVDALIYNKNSNLIYFEVPTTIYFTEGLYNPYAYATVRVKHSLLVAPL